MSRKQYVYVKQEPTLANVCKGCAQASLGCGCLLIISIPFVSIIIALLLG